jgi:colanic acid/amylovoran biosynthesis glycosyltransferase
VRLAYVTSSFPYGHGEGFLVAEVEELIRQGHELTLVPTFARGPVVHEDVRRFLPLVNRQHLLSPTVLTSAAREARRSRRHLYAAFAPVRHSRNALTLAKNCAVLPKALWLSALVRELAVDHIHAHWGGTSSTLAMVAADLSGVPWSLTAHRWDIRENNLLRVKADSAAFVRAISEDGLRDVDRIVGHARAPRHVLHMGVVLPDRPGRARERPVDEPLRVLVPANFIEVKGHRYLIDALGILRTRGARVVVELAGSGPLHDEIVRQVAEAGLANECVLLGQLSHSVLLESIGAGRWDAVMLASIETASGEKEGIPVALLEAMSHGLPVVATSVGGIPELLEGGAGLLVQPRDPVALADALARLSTDDELRARIARLGRDRVERDFEVTAVVRELGRLLEAATRDDGSRSEDRDRAHSARADA